MAFLWRRGYGMEMRDGKPTYCSDDGYEMQRMTGWGEGKLKTSQTFLSDASMWHSAFLRVSMTAHLLVRCDNSTEMLLPPCLCLGYVHSRTTYISTRPHLGPDTSLISLIRPRLLELSASDRSIHQPALHYWIGESLDRHWSH